MSRLRPFWSAALCLGLVLLPAAGCLHVKAEVKPIQITVDVNVKVQVERALDDFFGDLDRKSSTIQTP